MMKSIWLVECGGESQSMRLWVSYTIALEDAETHQQSTVVESTDDFDILDYFDDLLQP